MAGRRSSGEEAAGHELTLDDISDLRAYERERPAFRAHVIDLKRARRVPVGAIQTVVFENRDTVRFQIQEMARAERTITDEAIAGELLTYNPLVSRPGRLAATLFIELTSPEQVRVWKRRLAGVERSYELRLGDGDRQVVVRARLDEAHERTLTRTGAAPSVHYLWWPLTPAQTDALAEGPAALVCTHPGYGESTTLSDATRASLVADLR